MMALIETTGQVASWYHSKILRIPHGKQNPTKRYLTKEQVIAIFDGEVRVEEKIDGKLNALKMQNYYPDPAEFWIDEEIYSKTTVHNHIIKYKNAPHHVWLNKILIIDGEPQFMDILGTPNTLGYGEIYLPEPTIEQIYSILEAYSKLPSHYGAPEIEGLVLKNEKKQLMAKWVNDKFEDKIREQEGK